MIMNVRQENKKQTGLKNLKPKCIYLKHNVHLGNFIPGITIITTSDFSVKVGAGRREKKKQTNKQKQWEFHWKVISSGKLFQQLRVGVCRVGCCVLRKDATTVEQFALTTSSSTQGFNEEGAGRKTGARKMKKSFLSVPLPVEALSLRGWFNKRSTLFQFFCLNRQTKNVTNGTIVATESCVVWHFLSFFPN